MKNAADAVQDTLIGCTCKAAQLLKLDCPLLTILAWLMLLLGLTMHCQYPVGRSLADLQNNLARRSMTTCLHLKVVGLE